MNRRKEIQDELLSLAPTLAKTDFADPYYVPAGYFESFPQLILGRIKKEDENLTPKQELEAISPLLAGMKKSMPYSVPDNYFETLNPQVQTAVPKAKVISINPARLFKYAAAAAVVGLITVFAWFNLRDPKPVGNEMAAQSSGELQISNEIQNIPDSEMSAFLEGALFYPSENLPLTGELAETDMQIMLEDVPDSELERYLELNKPAKENFN